MNIQISTEAVNWYKSEMSLKKGDYVRFFARYGGCSTVQQGFSLGVSNEEPHDVGVQTTIDDIHFFIEEKDLWYFDNHNLKIDYNSDLGEPQFFYQ